MTIFGGPIAESLARPGLIATTHTGKWLDRAPTGGKVEFRVVIFFPWDSAERKFAGERVFVFP